MMSYDYSVGPVVRNPSTLNGTEEYYSEEYYRSQSEAKQEIPYKYNMMSYAESTNAFLTPPK